MAGVRSHQGPGQRNHEQTGRMRCSCLDCGPRADGSLESDSRRDPPFSWTVPFWVMGATAKWRRVAGAPLHRPRARLPFRTVTVAGPAAGHTRLVIDVAHH